MIFSIMFALIFEVVFWTIFISAIVRSVKRAKWKNMANKNSKNNRVDDFKGLGEDTRYVPKYYYTYCDYCGVKISKGDKKCPECKAKLNNK